MIRPPDQPRGDSDLYGTILAAVAIMLGMCIYAQLLGPWLSAALRGLLRAVLP